MIGRFFLLWLIVLAVVFAWTWFVAKPEKKVAKLWFKRAAISAVIALVIIGAGLMLNNISGV